MTLDCPSQCSNFAGEASESKIRSPVSEIRVVINMTRRSDSKIGNGLRSTVLTIEKTAVVAPIPSASATTAVTINAGLLKNM